MRKVTTRTIAGVLAEKWHQANIDAGPKPTALGTRFRHSDALGCARAVALTALGHEPSNPMDEAGSWVTTLGTKIHEFWQEAVDEAIDGKVEAEVKVQSFEDGSGHIDILLTQDDGYKICFEGKSCGGTKFRYLVGGVDRGRRLNAKGPARDHKVQVALNAFGADADEARLCYFSTEAIAIGNGFHGLDRFTAEFVMSRDEYEPLALQEIARVRDILATVDAGIIPDRLWPGESWPPAKMSPETTKYPCGYCAHRTTCIKLGAGEKSVGQL